MAIHPMQFDLNGNKQIWEALQYYKGLVSISLVSISLRLDTLNFVGTSNIHVRKKNQSTTKLPRYRLLKITFKFDYSKVHNCLLVTIFVVIFWICVFKKYISSII